MPKLVHYRTTRSYIQLQEQEQQPHPFRKGRKSRTKTGKRQRQLIQLKQEQFLLPLLLMKAIPNTGYLKWQGIALFYLFDDHISFNLRNLFERRDKSSYAFF